MSDSFVMLVDVDVPLDDAEGICKLVIADFANRGIILSELTPNCGLGGSGYPPGPTLPDLYELGDREFPFWTVPSFGVEPQITRTFNFWALGPSCFGFECPLCNAEFEPDDRLFFSSLSDAIGEWLKESGPAILNCPRCTRPTHVTAWIAKPPLGFGNLSFVFWNWPPFDVPKWRLDIPALVREITQHTIVVTHGHI